MKDVTFFLRGHARSDIVKIRQYTISQWGKGQWQTYKTALFNQLQHLANNPGIGMVIEEVSPNAFSFVLKHHVIYYLKKDAKIIFVGIISSEMSPEKHLTRKKNISNELSC